MAIHFLNCFTCCARVPSHWRTGQLCLLIETDRGLLLVDAGLGCDDYVRPPAILHAFRILVQLRMNPQEAAVHQLARLGYRTEDVRDIVLTHLHFDHAGGLRDFPHATVHVHRNEHEAFTRAPRRLSDLGYVRRHAAHRPEFVLYDDDADTWFDFPAIRLPFEPETWLVPLFGHTPGHCGVAIQSDSGWLFNVGSAAPIGFTDEVPPWLTGLMVGPHEARLRAFRAAHPEVLITTGHMWLDFFEDGLGWRGTPCLPV